MPSRPVIKGLPTVGNRGDRCVPYIKASAVDVLLFGYAYGIEGDLSDVAWGDWQLATRNGKAQPGFQPGAVRPPHKQVTAKIMLICGTLIAHVGCGGDARVNLAAADSVEALAANLATALTEYHNDLERSDDARERAAVYAFVERLRADVADEAKTNAHTGDFVTAMERLLADRQVEWRRYTASIENVSTLREVAEGLRRLAMESLSLEDEARRYFNELIELRRLRNTQGERETPP